MNSDEEKSVVYVPHGLPIRVVWAFFFQALLRMLCCDMNMEWKGEMHPFDSRVCDMNDGIVVGGTRCKRIRAMRYSASSGP